MKKFLKILFFVFALQTLSNAAERLEIKVNTNQIVVCERGYIQVRALNQSGSVDTNYNGIVEVVSSSPYTVFRNELEERDYKGKIKFFLTKGTNAMGDSRYNGSYKDNTRGIGFWEYEFNKTITLTVRDIEGKLITDSTTVNIINFNSPYNLIINEIMIATSDAYDTFGNASYFQWIEIYNPMPIDISISNFKIRKISYNSGGYWDITNKSAVSIKSKSYAIFCANINGLKFFFPSVPDNIPIIEGIIGEQKDDAYFPSSGTPIFLLDSNDKICDGLIYQSSWVPSIKNVSIERKDYNRPAYLKENWGECVSLKYLNYGAKGTPGATNSVSFKEKEAELLIDISLNKKIISPKNNEYLEIGFKLSEYAKVTVKIFSADGNEVIELLKHQDCGTDLNKIRFYCKDKNNRVLPSGIYILYFEALNFKTGKTATKSISFVISNKL